MSSRARLPVAVTHEVRDNCLCLHVQRAARALARHFDETFRPLGLTNGQFSLLMSLNRPDLPAMREVASLLGLDRTTLTAALKSLQRRGLVEVRADRKDRRSRRLILSRTGRALLTKAYPLWERAHAKLEARLSAGEPDRLRAALTRLPCEGGGIDS